METY
ncbi:hypothetical protein Pint_20966 [Pistacia integerrima]|jgi:hypothetical protein